MTRRNTILINDSDFKLPSFLAKDFLGFDTIFDKIEKTINTQEGINYPPHNIYTAMSEYDDSKTIRNEEHLFIEFALAGVQKDRIQVEFSHDNILTVKTKPVDYVDLSQNVKKYVYKGIADREFTIQKSVSKDLELVSCKMLDGVLTIEFRNKDKQEPDSQIIEIK